VAAEQSPVERLSGKPVELGSSLYREQGSWQAGGCGCLTPGWCLSQQDGAPVVPPGAGAGQGLMGGMGSGLPMYGRGSAGPEGQWVEGKGAGIAESCGTGCRLGSGTDWWLGSWWSWVQQHGQGAGIPAWCGWRA
jgi:hypothetical protein